VPAIHRSREIADIPPFYGKLSARSRPGDDRHHRSQKRLSWPLPIARARALSIPSTSKTAKRNSSASAHRPALRSRPGSGGIDEDKLQAQAFTRERKQAVPRDPISCSPKNTAFRRRHPYRPAGISCATATPTTSAARWKPSRASAWSRQPALRQDGASGFPTSASDLPAAAREVVNSVFLYYCTKAGLDLAIVNAEKLERFASIPEHERRLAESCCSIRLPWIPRTNPSARAEDWRAQARNRRPHQTSSISPPSPSISARRQAHRESAEALPLDERLAVTSSKVQDGLIADLERKRAEGLLRSKSSTVR